MTDYHLRHPGNGEIWLYVGDHPAQIIGTVQDNRYRDEFITSYNSKRRPAPSPAVADGWAGEPFRKGLNREAAMAANAFLPVDWNDQMRGHVWHAIFAYVNACASSGEWQTVPKEITPQMFAAYCEAPRTAQGRWAAMLAAAPAPPPAAPLDEKAERAAFEALYGKEPSRLQHEDWAAWNTKLSVWLARARGGSQG